jgi:hypothetical protein
MRCEEARETRRDLLHRSALLDEADQARTVRLAESAELQNRPRELQTEVRTPGAAITMKRLLLILGLLVGISQAQTTTTITGTIKDLSQALVTSGKVTFTLQPSRDTTISGLARFSPQQVVCLINASGLIKAQDGTSVCTLTMNTALNPPGTYYRVDVWPFNVKTSSFTFYAVLSTYDWSTVVPTPTTAPAQNFVDIFSTQTIGGNKTFSGNLTLQGTVVATAGVTISMLNGVIYVDGQHYALTGAGLAQAVSDCLALSTCPMVVAPNVSGVVSSTINLTRPVAVSLCQATLTLNGNPGINMSSSGASIQGCGQGVSVLTSGGTGDLIQINADKANIYNVDLEGNNLASIAIHAVGGNFQKIDKVFANGSSVAELQFEPTIGVNASISNSTFESNLTATPSININGNDGCGAGTAIPRHFTNNDTGGTPINIQGGSTVMLVNNSFGGITMTSASCKLLMVANRELNNPITFLGTNHTIVANTIAGAITLDSSLNNSTIGPNVSVGALTNNAAVTQNNNVIDNNTGNSYTMLPQMTVKNLLWSSSAPTISSGFGTSPSIVSSNGTSIFKVNVGTGGTATGGVIAMPAAATDWVCDVKNITALAANRANQWTVQTASTSTSVTVQNQTISTGAALAWTASDILLLKCGAE